MQFKWVSTEKTYILAENKTKMQHFEEFFNILTAQIMAVTWNSPNFATFTIVPKW